MAFVPKKVVSGGLEGPAQAGPHETKSPAKGKRKPQPGTDPEVAG
jgi:hypothetical protein